MDAKLFEFGSRRPVGPKDKDRREVENRDLAAVVGSNLQFSRNLNRMCVIDAQKLLGFASAGSVSKIEAGTSKTSHNGKLATARTPPQLLDMVYYAKLYGVSLDFLAGLSPYPEPDTKERAMHEAQMHTASTIRRFIDEATEAVLYSSHTGLDYKVRLDDYSGTIGELLRTLVAFLGKNKDSEAWQDMVLGNKLIDLTMVAADSHNKIMRDMQIDRAAKQKLADEQARQAGKRYPLLEERL